MLRDTLVFAVVMLGLPLAFRRPFVGLLLFSWLAYMRPQDLCWSFARDMRFSFFVAITMIAGWFANEQGRRPFARRDVRTVAMVVLLGLVTVSLAQADNHSAYVMTYYVEFCKIILIALFTTGQVDSKERLRTLFWTIALCLGFFGFKGGLFGVMTGGSPILRGPGGMLEDNNDFALALVMNVPLLFYLSRLEGRKWLRRACDVTILFTMVTVLLTHSRGGFLALSGTLLIMAWRSGKLLQAVGSLALLVSLFWLATPQHVLDRLATISEGASESSASARIRSWTIALAMIADHPVLGVGLRNFQDHYPSYMRELDMGTTGFAFVAHNSYLQIWAEAGTIAFATYLVLLGSVLWTSRRMRHLARGRPDLDWLGTYARMMEATTIGFMIGATFLNRGHFDLIYHWLALTTCLSLIGAAEARRVAAGHGAWQGRGERRDGARRRGGAVVVRWRPATAGTLAAARWDRHGPGQDG